MLDANRLRPQPYGINLDSSERLLRAPSGCLSELPRTTAVEKTRVTFFVAIAPIPPPGTPPIPTESRHSCATPRGDIYTSVRRPVDGKIGHTPGVSRLKMNDGFQLADLQRSFVIGKKRHVPAVALDSINCRKRPAAVT